MVRVLLMTIVIIASLCRVSSQTYSYDGYGSNTKEYTRKITLRQGVLQGVVVEPRVNHALAPVEQYLGIPYAAPPVDELRFMPPGSAPLWFGTKYADKFGPVCPQKFPSTNNMESSRKEYFNKLVKYLLNQSEDCLYLNIYAPVQDISRPYGKKYPVMVFIHGESFEWNSGNPYDGSVLAAYGKVIVVTLNFRLGILGFLKVGLQEDSSSNFGLVDQIAALLWVQDNISAFGGDPNSITLFGHGTGAACISLLILSPMITRDGKPLFHRAILMSGTALSDWALAGTPRQVTYQVAEALNCPTDEKLAACLRKKRLNEIMNVAASTRDYTTRFGPVVDGRVVPNDPNKIMSTYHDIFRRFELMYGLTELESVHLLEPVALTYGLLEKERDQELRKYLYTRCEYKPELYLAHTLAAYAGVDGNGEHLQTGYTGHEPDRASVARDVLLDMLSDARSAAPVALMGRYHAAVNPQSYFYVFGHTTAAREFIRNKTNHGEELPYVFGVPLDGPKFHFADHYNNQERLFSEVVMTLWSNFAYSGDPNIPQRQHDYMSLTPYEWRQYKVDWPEFDRKNEHYLYLGIPPEVRTHYRSKEINYWNEILPAILSNHTNMQYYTKPPPLKPTTFPFMNKAVPKNIPPWFPFDRGTSTEKFRKLPDHKPNDVAYGTVKLKPEEGVIHNNMKKEYGTIIMSQPQPKTGGTAMIVLIIVGGIFLLVNVVLFVGLYYKCSRLKTRETSQKRTYADQIDPHEGSSDKRQKLDDDELENGCSIMKMINSKSSKSGETYEAVRVSEDGSSKYNLSRHISQSTIDPHTKVRDWIAHEIVQRCSPKFLRRQDIPIVPMNNIAQSNSHVRTDSKTTESYSSLNRSPTRPVTPCEGDNKVSNIPKPLKVSVAIDATPGARSPSVLRQQPIELTKSLDYTSTIPHEACIRRSATLDNFLENKPNQEPTIVKIEHHHSKSKSEPITDMYGDPIYACPAKKMTTFDPNLDINVTSKEKDEVPALSPEESLMIIKRRNFPKVLPDYPDRQYLAQKRRSMPAHTHLFLPIPEGPSLSQPNSPTNKSLTKFPPAPPPRGCSTLGRKLTPIQSPAILAEEPPMPEEPEITCNNLYVGPLIPKSETVLNTQPIYDNLRSLKNQDEPKTDKPPKTIITTDPNNPIKKAEPKIIIKPTINKTADAVRNKTIPRVVARDNISDDEGVKIEHEKPTVKVKTPSLIPKLIKNCNQKESSSESSPSDESETGTVIKRV